MSALITVLDYGDSRGVDIHRLGRVNVVFIADEDVAPVRPTTQPRMQICRLWYPRGVHLGYVLCQPNAQAKGG